MDTAAVGHDDVVMPRKEMLVRNLTAGWPVVWSDKDAAWYKCIPCRDVLSQEVAARCLFTFARAYLAALGSARDDPVFDEQGDASRDTPTELLDDIQKSQNAKGEVTMGSIVKSFKGCSGKVFCHTLTLLTWAGHIGSFNTLAMYQYHLSTIVDAYYANKEWIIRASPEVAKV